MLQLIILLACLIHRFKHAHTFYSLCTTVFAFISLFRFVPSVRQWSISAWLPGSDRGSLGELQFPRGTAPTLRRAIDQNGRRGVQEARGPPMLGRCLVEKGSVEEPRRGHRVGDRESVQRGFPSGYIHDTDGLVDQAPRAREDPRDVDRHRPRVAGVEEFQQPEGYRVRSAEQSCVQVGEVLAVHAQGEARAVQGVGENFLGGEQRVDPTGAFDQRGHGQVCGHGGQERQAPAKVVSKTKYSRGRKLI